MDNNPFLLGKGGQEYFALKIQDDSMYPEYRIGDVVIMHCQATCESGQDCVVIAGGGAAVFRRIRISDRYCTLQPINSSCNFLVYSKDELKENSIRILGTAVEIRRPV